jgi:hypothetical protein
MIERAQTAKASCPCACCSSYSIAEPAPRDSLPRTRVEIRSHCRREAEVAWQLCAPGFGQCPSIIQQRNPFRIRQLREASDIDHKSCPAALYPS